MNKQLDDTDLMPFGEHKGERMEDVPASYLHWLWTNGMKERAAGAHPDPVADYIRRNLSGLKIEYKDGIWE